MSVRLSRTDPLAAGCALDGLMTHHGAMGIERPERMTTHLLIQTPMR